MTWAKHHDCIVFTNDLDFSAILASTKASGPSILQLRTQDVLPTIIGEQVFEILELYRELLIEGAIVTIDKIGARLRILPIKKRF